MSQKNEIIHIKDLVLWTENPRDSIEINATDQDIANRSMSRGGRNRWSLKKLFDTMGHRFDQSEIPTVSYINDKPVVFDGNRRVLIGKIIHGYVAINSPIDFSGFEFPEEIPCNVCDKNTALEHVDRKHGESGSWEPLERDIFRHKHMKDDKSTFLVFEESTNLISNNKAMNQRFVKEEILTPAILDRIGFSVDSDQLKTRHSDSEANALLEKIVSLINEKEISTRKNRGELISLLEEDPKIKVILKNNKNQALKNFSSRNFTSEKVRKTRIQKGKKPDLYGETIAMRPGIVNNLYSDLRELHSNKKKIRRSDHFPMLIRMGLRLLAEIAMQNKNKKLEVITDYFDEAKNGLTKDEKTTLSTQNVSKDNIIELLHVGAHSYTATNNLEQTVALSLVIGKILEKTHGK